MAEEFDVVVLGAGAAGMMCAAEAGRRERRVVVLDHASQPGEKIRISGGGRCNFTNLATSPKSFLSANPHFAKSALARYTPQDFLALVEKHNIAWHEKAQGQLFCDVSARDIVRLLVDEIAAAGATLRLSTPITSVEASATGYRVVTENGIIETRSLVVATGGKSIPKMGATGLAYRIAEQFGLPLIETRPGLVPLTLDPGQLERLVPLAGVAVPVEASCGKGRFRDALLVTHRGLSGPAILQISSYWREGEAVDLHLLPDTNVAATLKAERQSQGRQAVQTALATLLTKSLAQHLCAEAGLAGRPLADMSDKAIDGFVRGIENWVIKPAGSEGYRTAEVTLGGVDTRALNSRTFEANGISGLFFIGECVDVTGWLGGYNFQWAWSSGFCAGQAV